MKKITKKLFVLLLSAVMILATGVSAFAAESTTKADLSVNNDTAGAAYTAYKVMDATISGRDSDGEPVYTYTVTKEFQDFFKDGAYGYTLGKDNVIKKDGEAITTDGRNTNTNKTEAAKLANALKNYALAKKLTGTTLPAEGIDIGYYVVAETAIPAAPAVASKPMLVDLRSNTELTPKKSDVDLDKKIVDGDNKVDENTASIGSDVKYEVTATIPTYEANVDKDKLSYVLTDTFTNLNYNKDIEIKADGTLLTKGSDYTIEETDDSFVVTLSQETILKYQGATLTLKYSATLTEDAVVDDPAGNPNHIKLDYTNNPDVADSKGTLEDEVKTYTYGFKIHKVDKNDNEADMAGAAFEIRDSAGNVIGTFEYGEGGQITATGVVITKEGNYATIKGVKAGKYTIKETKAPAGYAKLAAPVEIEIKACTDASGKLNGLGELEIVSGSGIAEVSNDDGDHTIGLTIKIENVKGISLPETGGTTAMYCLIGGMILLVLGGLYFAMNRASRRREQ